MKVLQPKLDAAREEHAELRVSVAEAHAEAVAHMEAATSSRNAQAAMEREEAQEAIAIRAEEERLEQLVLKTIRDQELAAPGVRKFYEKRAHTMNYTWRLLRDEIIKL